MKYLIIVSFGYCNRIVDIMSLFPPAFELMVDTLKQKNWYFGGFSQVTFINVLECSTRVREAFVFAEWLECRSGSWKEWRSGKKIENKEEFGGRQPRQTLKRVSESLTEKTKDVSVKYVFILSSRQTLGLWFIVEQSWKPYARVWSTGPRSTPMCLL